MRGFSNAARTSWPEGADDVARCRVLRGRVGSIFAEVIEIMSAALAACIESLPEPVSATQVHHLAESILDSAGRGEREVATLVRIALVELQISPHH